MSILLQNIQETVIKYAEVLSQILKVDVEIMDDKLIRIAGTGSLKNKINESMRDEGYVYKTVLKTGKPQIVKNPRKETICLNCPSRNCCLEKFEVSMPIKYNDEVIGVIGLVCFDEKQTQNLNDNLNTYMVFLQQISDLISAKAYEQSENERVALRANLLNKIIDRIEQGVVILDKNNYISQINKKAQEIFKLKDYKQIKFDLISTGDLILNNPEYIVKIGRRKYSLAGNIYDIKLEKEKYDRMFIFTETKTIKSNILNVTNSNEGIGLDKILCVSDKMMELKKEIVMISKSTSTVLITGESGTGKELIARAIHNESNRKNNPFVAINCGAIPESLLESELFGYARGAFTGADARGKIGKFELANKGTIFLDEIGDMPLYMQVKLLRVLQDKVIVRVGSNNPIKVDVRVISATNKNLESMIKEGTFREDLYYRLNVIPIEVPPLRERIDDIKILTEHFCMKYSRLFNKKFQYIDKEVWDIFLKYRWPGNVRELENTVEFMVNVMDDDNGILSANTIPNRIIHSLNDKENKEADLNLELLEKRNIEKALELYGKTTAGKKIAAEKLGISLATLYRKLEKYKFS
ncbi:MAG TPA: AAA family ATPase [Clostridiaceae bacterium]|nr:AAA family ATPase [Clostridiaceae bacterium]HBF77146.1 AAA family ATPase [Clostridiaceae bacterium]HBG38125.1 AAA family ATPase [Clostridiaceae bacterium]HBN28289.1 AAA family ATPase [Clostridiaceae bacterium]HBX48168.1 AAA family ATPase [Clostridiaceae bacterium]